MSAKYTQDQLDGLWAEFSGFYGRDFWTATATALLAARTELANLQAAWDTDRKELGDSLAQVAEERDRALDECTAAKHRAEQSHRECDALSAALAEAPNGPSKDFEIVEREVVLVGFGVGELTYDAQKVDSFGGVPATYVRARAVVFFRIPRKPKSLTERLRAWNRQEENKQSDFPALLAEVEALEKNAKGSKP